MDLECRFCGEPLDHGELTGSPTQTPQKAFDLFKAYGCGALDLIFGTTREPATECTSAPIVDPERLEYLAERYEFSHDIDTYYEAR